MESLKNSSSSRDEARLEAWLREPTPSVPDNGFSARVLAALPPTRANQPSHLLVKNLIRLAVCLVGAATGEGIAYAVGLSLSVPPETFDSVRVALENPGKLGALVVAALAVGYALRPRRLTR